MSWFKKTHLGFKIQRQRERDTPDGLWRKCDGCGEILYVKDLERNLLVCSKCNFHFRIGARDYIALLTDPHSFEELFASITSTDPLTFKDTKRYRDRLKETRERTGSEDAVVTGIGTLRGLPLSISVMDFVEAALTAALQRGRKRTAKVLAKSRKR